MTKDLAPKQRSCYKCGYFAETVETICPQCKLSLFTTTNTRIRGGLLAAIGLFLIAVVGYLMIWSFSAFGNTGTAGPKFTGTQQEKLMIVAVFSTLILFGFFSLITGGWQLFFGRRNRVLAWSVVGLGIVLAVGAGGIIWFFE